MAVGKKLSTLFANKLVLRGFLPSIVNNDNAKQASPKIQLSKNECDSFSKGI